MGGSLRLTENLFQTSSGNLRLGLCSSESTGFVGCAMSANPNETGPTRTLTASPLSVESRVELQAGAVMVFVFVGLLVLGRFALQFLGVRSFGYRCVGILSVGNVTALAREIHEPSA